MGNIARTHHQFCGTLSNTVPFIMLCCVYRVPFNSITTKYVVSSSLSLLSSFLCVLSTRAGFANGKMFHPK